MLKFEKKQLVLAALASMLMIGLGLSGCSSTAPKDDSDGVVVTSSSQGEQVVNWINPDFEAKPYATLLVIFYDEDALLRRQAEAYFLKDMAKHNVKVIASSAVELNVVRLEDSLNVVNLAEAQGAQAVITVEFKEFKKGYRPPSKGYGVAWLAAALIDDDLRRAVWATSVADRALSSLASMEVELWDLQSETKVWAGTTNVQTYDNVKSDTKRFTEMVVKDLSSNGFIGTEKLTLMDR
ncbi:MAG: hypothetical protein V7754_21405 [Halioglobus sp.]